jgi:glutamine amidotransferase
MCRHLAYVGPPVTLQALLVDPPHSLHRQAWAPRMQRHGTVNADGFGAGWYVDSRPEPVRYRRAQPIWADASFASLAPTIESRAVLAAVRDATPGFAAADESCCAPFAHDGLLFSHNGRVEDWPGVRKALWDQAWDIPEATAPVDSALLFGLVAARWQAGRALADVLASVVADVEAHGGGRLNLLATDGRTVAATTWGERTFHRVREDSAVVASEPFDDDDGWEESPEGTVLEASSGRVSVRAIDVAGPRG